MHGNSRVRISLTDATRGGVSAKEELGGTDSLLVWGGEIASKAAAGGILLDAVEWPSDETVDT